jgi:hypothetical protein
MANNSAQRSFALVTCIITWAGLVLQYYVALESGPQNNLSFIESTTRFFGYFTVLTNLLVAIWLTAILFSRGSWHRFFSRFSTQTAITVYILVVGLGYNILLRHLYVFRGLHAITTEIQHVAVPALATIYWIVFVPKHPLSWSALLPWLFYPFVYLVMALLRGSMDSFYPYPFLNVADLGFGTVLRNAAGLLVVFVVVSLVFIFFSRRSPRR